MKDAAPLGNPPTTRGGDGKTQAVKRRPAVTASLLLSLAFGGMAAAQDAKPAAESSAGSAPSADEIARQLANPNNSLASLTFRGQYRWYTGDLPNADDQGNFTLLFQPAFPFPLKDTVRGGKANLFVRPAIPWLVRQPVFESGVGDFHGTSALGDIGFDIGYGVTEKNGFLWAYGMVGTLPTATDSEVAGKQLRLGPELMLARFFKWGVLGILPSHQWNVTGWSDASFSTTTAQVFLQWLPGGGWNVGTIPIMSYDWITDEATIPLNLSVGRTIPIGKTPVKLQLEANYYVTQADAFGPRWMIGLNVTPVVPNVIAAWVKGQ